MNGSLVKIMRNAASAAALAALLAGTATAGHVTAVGQSSCSYCHKTSLDVAHGGFGNLSCQKCHTSATPSVKDTIAAGNSGQPYTCATCHGTGIHLPKHAEYAASWQTAPGIDFSTAGLWEQPLQFAKTNPANSQAQACVRCHSYAGFGMFAGGLTAIQGPSGVKLTDQALEFNPSNRSAHPVMTVSSNFDGSLAPKPLAPAQMATPWTNLGNQSMTCSDCHSFTSTGSGPQGSAAKFSLKGPRIYWPYNAAGQLWTLADIKSNTNSWSTNLFCKNCHTLYSSNAFANNVHSSAYHNARTYTINNVTYRGAPCVSCHLAVPHGGKHSRLIGYGYQATAPDTVPHIFDQNVALVRGFVKAPAPKSYLRDNCFSTFSPCHVGHTNKLSYEP